MYKYAMLGFGGLGKKHFANLIDIGKNRGDIELVAICGTTLEDVKKNVATNLGVSDVSSYDYSNCHFYQDYKELLDNEELDFVLSVLPTFLHEDAAVYALSKGIHVFSEKPMALSVESCDKMLSAAKVNNKKLMIGQICRFNPGYIKIKEYIDKKKYGKLLHASFERYSQTPMWTYNNWILDTEKSGGCLLDLHVHDVDLINYFFGMPNSLVSVIRNSKIERDGISTQYFYDDFMIDAHSDWSYPQTFPFRSSVRLNFEKGLVILEGGFLKVYTDEENYEIDCQGERFYEEIDTFLKVILDGEDHPVTSAESVRDSIRLVEMEIESSDKKARILCK